MSQANEKKSSGVDEPSSVDEPPVVDKPRVDEPPPVDGPPRKRPRPQHLPTDEVPANIQLNEWNDLKKSINDQIEHLNRTNLPEIVRSLFKYNLIRGRGILADALMEKQMASPHNTDVYASLISIINSKFPQITQLICKRVIHLYRDYFAADNGDKTFALIKFLAHLINQSVLHEQLAFQIIRVLLRNSNVTSDSVKLSLELLREAGQKLAEANSTLLDNVFRRFNVLRNGPLITQNTKKYDWRLI